MKTSIEQNFLESSIRYFTYYMKLGEGAIAQLSDEQVQTRPNNGSNSIAHMVHHLSGNMLSRWTDFLTSDGEKPWRNREAEFDESYPTKASMMEAWERGWGCLLQTLGELEPDDLHRFVYIRNEGQTVLEAVQRQLAHYPYHVGQIVYQAKALLGDNFKSLSIPRGGSEKYNQQQFEGLWEQRHPSERA